MEVNAIQQMLSRLRQVQEDLQRQVNAVAVDSKDQEMLQDLIRAAVNEASRRVDEELANQMKNLAGGIPGIAGMKIPGLF